MRLRNNLPTAARSEVPDLSNCATGNVDQPTGCRAAVRAFLSIVPVASARRTAYSPGSIPTGKRKVTRSDFGGKWKSVGTSEAGGQFQVEGEYLEIDPPRLLVYTWRSSWRDFRESKVRWDLAPSNGGTLLKIRHAGLAQDPEGAKNYGGGWPRVLAWMQAFVERGETVDTRK